jgi:nucleotide-binding universal stress UspA family protein
MNDSKSGSPSTSKLLVGFDGSNGGRDALALAKALASPSGASPLVVTVLPYDPFPVGFEELEEDAAAKAEPLFEEARESLAGLSIATRVFGGGSPARVMTHLAEEEDIDTIVVGSPHRGALGRALIGSTAESLLHGAPCAVVAAPRGYLTEARTPFRLIAIAYDGTAESRLALHRAEAIAKETGAAVRVLTVVSPPVARPGVVGYTSALPPEPEKIVEEATNALHSSLAIDGRCLTGPVAATLAEACEEGVDLLLAGSRRYGPVMRVLLGSVSTQLIHKAPCPVMVVPRP